MPLATRTRFHIVAPLAVVLSLAVSGTAPGQVVKQGAPPKTVAKAKAQDGRASGVIMKVEKVAKSETGPSGKTGSGTIRVSINTNAVWRDWVRDQAQVTDSGPPRKDAAKGAKSVATTGEPADENSLVMIEVSADTKIMTRFRTPDDETGKGGKTPEAARAEAKGEPKGTDDAKPVKFAMSDLKTGLFVEADFKNASPKHPASAVTVIRPVTATGVSTGK